MEYLIELLRQHHVSGNIAEIGTFHGDGSTQLLMEYALERHCHFFAIDIFLDDAVYQKITRQLSEPQCRAIKGPSVTVGQNWPEDRKLDFLFIDGDHGFPHITKTGSETGVMLDILTWHPHLNPGGILAFHDYTGTDSHYGEISLLAVEVAVDSLCRPPAYKFLGRRDSIIAFQKTGTHVLAPAMRLKKAVPPYAAAWERLNRLGDLPPLIIYGTGGGAKYLLDSILTNQIPFPEIIFTDSTTQRATTVFADYPLLPKEEALLRDGIVVSGSLYEEEIQKILEQHGLIHLKNYFNHFEFIGWCHVGRLSATC